MSSSEKRRAQPVRRGEGRLTLAAWFALVVALIPLTTVVAPGMWVAGAVLLPGLMLLIGRVLRWLRWPAVAVTGVLAAVWVVTVTLFFFADDALWGFLPGTEVIRSAVSAVEQASAEILAGIAPVEPTPALSFVLVAAVGLLTVALDHVILTARMPLLASIGLFAVWLIPAVAVPSETNLVAFVLLAAAVLLLWRAETRTRESPEPGSSAGVTAIATAVGAVTVVVTLVAVPLLPAPLRAAPAVGLSTINPTLDLGQDLRQPAEGIALTVHSDAASYPYLRLSTLSVLDGDVWLPDRTRSFADQQLDPVVVDDGIQVTQYVTTIDIDRLSTSYLPVPGPAVSVADLTGIWRSVPYNRTFVSSNSGTQGQHYTVTTQVPRPTREQIQARSATPDGSAIDALSLPDDTPAIVAELANEVTAGATNDYDRLIALQTWFRGPEFSYSLDTPVEDGYDGSGTEAVAEFLQVKSGYCVHFSAAFALMARSLGMPARIVVGFLPGTATGQEVDGERVGEVNTNQLHAWPEVHFDGIGWVAFEPTKSLGDPTRFLGQGSPMEEGGQNLSTPTPTPTPSRTAQPSSSASAAPTAVAAPTGGFRLPDLRPILIPVGVVVVVALAPLTAGAWRRRRQLTAAQKGDTAGTWSFVRDAAVDLGLPVSTAESPRVFGDRLVAAGAPGAEVSRIIGSVERASYARPGPRTRVRPATADDLTAIRTALRGAATPAARFRGLWLPASLWRRDDASVARDADRTVPE